MKNNVFKVTIEPENSIDNEAVVMTPAPKRPPGRPRKFKEEDKTEVIGVRLLAEEVRFLEEYGGKYGGKTGYVTYLVRQEMDKILKK